MSRLAPPPEGVRRSRRHRISPLAFWRQERVVYGRPSDAGTKIFVPHIREIIRVPLEPVEPLGKKRKRRGDRAKSESRAKSAAPVVFNPEEGWDDDTNPMGNILDFVTQEEVEKREYSTPLLGVHSNPASGIAFTSQMVKPKAAANNDWFFQKVFGDADFIAAGLLIIPPQGRKPSKGTEDNTYVFVPRSYIRGLGLTSL